MVKMLDKEFGSSRPLTSGRRQTDEWNKISSRLDKSKTFFTV